MAYLHRNLQRYNRTSSLLYFRSRPRDQHGKVSTHGSRNATYTYTALPATLSNQVELNDASRSGALGVMRHSKGSRWLKWKKKFSARIVGVVYQLLTM